MKKYAYLVSDGNKVSVTLTKPRGVRVGKRNWRERFTRLIGEGVTVYMDDPWKGVIGVYDISKEKQVIQLVTDMRAHTLDLASRMIENAVHSLVGKEASSEVRGYKWVFDAEKQRKHKWSPVAKLLRDIELILHSVCSKAS